MMNQLCVLDVSYGVAFGNSISQYAAVVCGANDGFAALPAGQNAAGFLGITQNQVTQSSQANCQTSVSVRKLGVAWAVSNGAINYGDHLIIASAVGDVMSVEATIQAGTNGLLNVIGKAESSATASGQPVFVWLDPQVIPAA